MDTVRFYGEAPYAAALVHGGPGAPGSIALVARGLFASGISTIEPFQTATTVQGQIAELAQTIRPYGPLTLVGHSWGAWLATLTAAQYPDLLQKLILVSSGPFEAHYAGGILDTRLSRMTSSQREEAEGYLKAMHEGTLTGDEFAAFGGLMDEVDTYCPVEKADDSGLIPCDSAVFSGVWAEADTMRASGELLKRAAEIRCPVIVIHGDYDPHPYRGVEEPLERILDDFQFFLLTKCGHTPWEERYARDAFFQILRDEII